MTHESDEMKRRCGDEEGTGRGLMDGRWGGDINGVKNNNDVLILRLVHNVAEDGTVDCKLAE